MPSAPVPPRGEISFGVAPDFGAGLPCLGGTPVTFTSQPLPVPPPAIPVGTLNAASSLFDSPQPGTLRYRGTLRLTFEVHYQLVFILTTDTSVALPPPIGAPLPFRPLLAVLLHNDQPVNSSASAEELGEFTSIQQGLENVATFNGHALLSLEPNDTLEIGMLDILTSDVGTLTDSGCINALSVMATVA